MIMNYVLSFCKITGASRIFSRNFYLPLLKPITPKDALRTFKITGKWLLGSKIHHYIPVLFNHKKKRSKKVHDYAQIDHRLNDSYTYMSPVIDSSNEAHAMLVDLLKTKDIEGCSYFVYTVEDKMYNLVFPAKLEVAIQDGDIIDVLISQSNDKILIKFKDFKKIALELEFYDNKDELKKGEGATSVEEEKFHHHGKVTMSLAKIFEAKELAEEWELEMMKIVAKKKKQKGEGSKEWNEMVTESIQHLDWQQFEIEAKKVIDQIWEPVEEEFIGMQVEDLEKTRNVPEFILKQGSALLCQLPTLTEIPEVVKAMATAVYQEIEEDLDSDDSDELDKPKRRISGVRVTLASGKVCFITGQMVKTDEGDVFVPGQTIENEFGLSYAPGITINMDNKPTLIKGLIMGEEDNQNPMFLPTESSITADGELTFCRNPEEKSSAKPKKIFIKRESQDCMNDLGEIPNQSGDKKKKKKKKKKIQEVIPEPLIDEEILVVKVEEEPQLEVVVIVEQIEVMSVDSERIENVLPDVEEYEKKIDEDVYKPLDDGMDKLIGNLEDKKSELQEKLDALRKLTITLENSVTYVSNTDANALAELITQDSDKMHKLSDILLTITRRATTFRERNNVNIQNINNPSMVYNNTFITEADEKFQACSQRLKIALKSATFAANEVFKTRPKDQLLALNTLTDILKNTLIQQPTILEELCLLMNTNLDRNEICTSILKELTQEITENKIEVLKSCLNERLETSVVIDKITQVLEKDGCIFAASFKKLAKNCEALIKGVIDGCKQQIDGVKTEQGARECVQVCIVNAIKLFGEEGLEELDDNAGVDDIKDFIGEALGLATTLGMYDVEDVLTRVLIEPDTSLMSLSKNTLEFLKRFDLIRKLSERDYSLKTALQRIKKHPETGRTDPRIRQLLMESACLLSKAREIKNSLEIPLRLFQDQNFLAIEDCVNQKSRIESPLIISRKGIQAIIPKEAARNVLAGRVPYMLIDESGATNFKPMHMFSAMKLGKNREKRYEDYPIMGGRESNDAVKTSERVYAPPAAIRTSPVKTQQSQASDVRRRLRSLSSSRMKA